MFKKRALIIESEYFMSPSLHCGRAFAIAIWAAKDRRTWRSINLEASILRAGFVRHQNQVYDRLHVVFFSTARSATWGPSQRCIRIQIVCHLDTFRYENHPAQTYMHAQMVVLCVLQWAQNGEPWRVILSVARGCLSGRLIVHMHDLSILTKGPNHSMYALSPLTTMLIAWMTSGPSERRTISSSKALEPEESSNTTFYPRWRALITLISAWNC